LYLGQGRGARCLRWVGVRDEGFVLRVGVRDEGFVLRAGARDEGFEMGRGEGLLSRSPNN
jgi:hypothetical protein